MPKEEVSKELLGQRQVILLWLGVVVGGEMCRCFVVVVLRDGGFVINQYFAERIVSFLCSIRQRFSRQ